MVSYTYNRCFLLPALPFALPHPPDRHTPDVQSTVPNPVVVLFSAVEEELGVMKGTCKKGRKEGRLVGFEVIMR